MGDARGWSREAYEAAIMAERRRSTRIVFALKYAPLAAPKMVAAATSDGAVALHSLPSQMKMDIDTSSSRPRPLVSLPAHDGPAYDLLSFEKQGSELLASCGDDGRVLVWRWKEILDVAEGPETTSDNIEPVTVFTNPQQRGPHGAVSHMPETNAIAADVEAGKLFSASGDGCAYAWDLETGQSTEAFRGHGDYLHCISARPSHKQVATGSEDGTARIWDCRSGRCTAILDAMNAIRLKRQPRTSLPWVSCMSIDATENWMVCGSGANSLTLWNLPMVTAATRIATQAAPQDVTFTKDQIVVVGAHSHISHFGYGGNLISQVTCSPPSVFSLDIHASGVMAVGGYEGLIDVISNYGSHLCAFCC